MTEKLNKEIENYKCNCLRNPIRRKESF